MSRKKNYSIHIQKSKFYLSLTVQKAKVTTGGFSHLIQLILIGKHKSKSDF